MKKPILLIVAVLLSGGAHALTANRVVKASSNTYITDSLIQDDGTGVGISTAPLSGQKLVVNGTIKSSSGGFVFPDGSTQTTTAVTGTGAANRIPFYASASTLQSDAGLGYIGSSLFAPSVDVFGQFFSDILSPHSASPIFFNFSAVNVGSMTATDFYYPTIRSTSGGYVFPDGSTQTTTANSFAACTMVVSTSATNTASEVTILGPAAAGSKTIAANRLKVGTVVRVIVYGDYTTTGSPPTTATFKFKIGSLSYTFALMKPPASKTSLPWKAEVAFGCRSTGASGTMSGAAFLTVSADSISAPYVANAVSDGSLNTGASVLDTTVANAVDMTVTWSSAVSGNTIRSQTATIEILN